MGGICCCSWAAPGKTNPPVQVDVRFPSLSLVFEKKHSGESPEAFLHVFTRLRIGAAFGFKGKEPSVQYLDAVDSTGRKLKPVKFEISSLRGWPADRGEEEEVVGCFQQLPSPGATWVSLKGTLFIPVAPRMESPCCRLPLESGSSAWIPLSPGPVEEDVREEAGDIAMAGEVPMGKVELLNVEYPEEGKVEVGLVLISEWDIEPDEFILLDEQGNTLKFKESSLIGCRSGNMEGSGKSLVLDAGDVVSPLNVKVRFKGKPYPVSVPVNTKVSLGGEIK